MQARRVFGDAAVLDNGVCAGTIESSSGNASDAPTPRRTVRREMCFLVINMPSLLFHRLKPVPPLHILGGTGFSLCKYLNDSPRPLARTQSLPLSSSETTGSSPRPK